MDCRTSVMLAWCLALGGAGCQTTTTTTTGPNAHVPAGAVVKASEPSRKPKAETLVALAKVRLDQADEPNISNESQTKLRDNARELYQQALQMDANHIPAYRGLTQVYLKLRDADRALETIHAAIKVNAKSGALWADLAMCHNCRKEYEQAIQCLNKALELEPENREFAQKLGLTLARAGRIEPSLAILSKTYGPDNAHYSIARMMHHMHQEDACKEQLRQTLAANPNHREAQEMLAMLERGGNAGIGTPPVPAELAPPSAVLPPSTVRSSSE